MFPYFTVTYEDDKNVDECKTGDNANEISGKLKLK